MRLLPMWPAILRPGNTRAGVAHIPMEPCCRLDLEPWVMFPRAMPHRLMLPARRKRSKRGEKMMTKQVRVVACAARCQVAESRVQPEQQPQPVFPIRVVKQNRCGW